MPAAAVAELPVSLFKGPVEPDWCPGCGDFGVLNALKKAVAKLGIQPKDLMVVSGIGCSSNLPGFIHSYGVHSLHGRSVPVAQGVKLANHAMTVVITGGDGDGYGIGLGHFVHAVRRNIDILYIVMDNQIYGLTTGQASPTTCKGDKTKSTPTGNPEAPINPCALALVSGGTWVGRGFSGDPNGLADLMAQGIEHRGFALLDVFSPCVTYNMNNTYPWFRPRVYNLQKEGHDTSDRVAAVKRAFEWGDRIPLGIFYKEESIPLDAIEPALKKGPLVQQPLRTSPEIQKELMLEFM
ncbi:MAG: thiamine pyrophosphate-dependent enzyme [Planctomycetales bacterium]|nr:thiamine pyrophosphate-dependent enzyme [Planctomycetales bacterium]